MATATTTVSAVHEEDARAFLDSVGLLGAFDDGTLHCGICDRELRTAELGAVTKRGDAFVFACARLDCVRDLV